MTHKILLTGFDAFGGAALNPSWLAARALHGRRILGHTVVAAQLPTEFDTSIEALTDLMEPLGLNWKARRVKELDLMADLMPLLLKRAAGREISGLSAYEQ